MKDVSHYDLCKTTANRFLKDSTVVLFEYQSYATSEFPDVLCFKGGYTKLYEIKVDKQDFKRDKLKDCRVEKRLRYRLSYHCKCVNKKYKDFIAIAKDYPKLQEYIKEATHLGRKRYYVCPSGLIQPEEIGNEWGLYWYNGRFSKKKESKNFKCNIYDELSILEHAFRKYYCGDANNVLVNGYK